MSTAPAAAVLEPAPPEVKGYQRQKRTARVVNLLLHLVLLTVAALVGPVVDRLILRELVGDNRWLRLIAAAVFYGVLVELIALPIGFYSGFLLEHRYGLSTQTLRRWAGQRLKGYGVGGAIGLPLLLGFYAILWLAGPYWWLAAAAGWLFVTLVLGQLLPVVVLPLFYKVTRFDDGPLLDRLRQLAAGTGLSVEGVYRLGLSEETRKANAALTGLGRTRRVLLGDTLLERFTPEEVEVVFAHEVGHHVHRHLAKFIAANVLTATLGFALVDLIGRPLAVALGYPDTPGQPAFTDPAALPLLLLMFSLLGLFLAPAMNALSRFFEVQCDRYALRRTRNPDAFRSAFAKLARLNKSDPDPHPLVVWLFYDHPPIRQRLALADEKIAPV
jgi:STE24 endopeptidase